MPRALTGRKPRRYKDHRTRTAKQWAERYDAIAERYPPQDRLARSLTAMSADFLRDYETLRTVGYARGAKSKHLSPIRKTAGLFLATLRVLGGGNGLREPEDLARLIAAAREGTSDEG